MRKILFLSVFLCASILTYAEEVTFDFSDPAQFGFAVPAKGGFTQLNSGDQIIKNGVVISPTFSSGNGLRFFANTNTGVVNLRAYIGSEISISAPAGSIITQISFAGSNLTANSYLKGDGYASSSSSAASWEGRAEKVSLSCIKSTVQMNTMTVVYESASGIPSPTFSIPAGVYYAAQTLTLTATVGDVYYSFDNVTFDKYTTPLTISETKDVYAYAQSGETKSSVKHAEYKIAKNYESLDELLKETPTAEGTPVIVPIKDEEIASFYIANNQFKNGVYLTRMANGKNFELFKEGVPEAWNIGDKISGTAKGLYQDYKGQWEISLNDEGWALLSNSGDVPTVSAPSIAFDENTKTVTITDPSGNNFDIYYTTDGTNPVYGVNGTKYTAPFTITTTTTVKAICVSDWEESSSIATKLCSTSQDYNSLAELQAIAANYTSATIEVKLNLNNVLVTGVNGSNVFVQDNSGAFLFYGSGSKLAKGDIISGSISGKPYMYNGLPEMSITDSWANVTVVSHDNAVAPTVTKAANVSANDANKYVRFEGLKFVKSETVSNKTNYTLTDGTTNIVLRDNFNNLGSISWNVGDAYSYNINVFVIPYKTDLQYYAVSDKDVEMVSSKTSPETEFAKAVELVDLNAKNYTPEFQTKSDGAKTWTSSNTRVATIDETGKLTILNTGVTAITLETAETATYQTGKATITIAVANTDADGSKDHPLGVGDVQALFAYYNHSSQEVVLDTIADKWVKAYIVGCANGSLSKPIFGTEGAVETNLLISDDPSATDVNICVPAALDNKSAAREALNLKSHPENLGKEVLLHGSIMKYFSVAGLKSIDEFELVVGLKGDANGDGQVNVNDITTIASYILDGKVDGFNFDNADVNGDGNINVNDITSTATIILGN